MPADLKQQFSSYITSEKLFSSDEKLLLACSGGIDSMVLAHLLLALDIPFEVAHVNYGLRGDESDGDEFFIRKYCRKYFLPIHVHRVKSPPNDNVQDWARRIRYKFFNKLLPKLSISTIVTAHHFDDQIETFIQNFTRGTGIAGLRGMKTRHKNIARPLLFARKSDIDVYANRHGIAWREDSSNAKGTYQRNQIRHDITPKLRALRSTDVGMEKTFEHLQETDQWLHDFFNSKLNTYREINGRYTIPINQYSDQHGQFELYQLIRRFGFQRDQIADIIMSNRTGAKFSSASHLATIDRGYLLIKEKVDFSLAPILFHEDELPIKLDLGNRGLCFELKNNAGINTERHVAQFDKEQIQFPIQLRKWQQGDRFQPFGMYGKTKKVSDLFVHLKLTTFDKEEALVLTDAKETILWVVGYRRSWHAPIAADANTIIECTLTYAS